MRRLIALVALGALAASSAFAQGTLNFANFGFANNYPILLPAYMGGGPAGPSDGVLVDLYYGTAADRLTALGLRVEIQGNGLFTATALGNSNPVVLPGIGTGREVYVKMVAWIGGDSYEYANGVFNETPVFHVAALGGGTIPTPNIPMGIGSLQLILVPEPSTYALMALGLGGLLFFRRRK